MEGENKAQDATRRVGLPVCLPACQGLAVCASVSLLFLLLLLHLTTILDNDEAGVLGNALGLLLNLVHDALPFDDFPCARACCVSACACVRLPPRASLFCTLAAAHAIPTELWVCRRPDPRVPKTLA